MNIRALLRLAAIAGLASLTLTAQAETADAAKWTGEGSFSAGTSTGNTETTDLGLGVTLGREMGVWKVGLQANADYGETEGQETKNRIFLGANLDRQINDKLFGFGQLSYEQDEFSGFSSRTFIGGGLGYEVFNSEKMQWTVRGGPGLKIDEIEATLATPASTEESFSATAQSNWAYSVNDNVSLSNDTSVLYAETSTQIGNITGLTATLTNTLSARVSFEVRHDTDPPTGFEQTDTISRISLVYAFGK